MKIVHTKSTQKKVFKYLKKSFYGLLASSAAEAWFWITLRFTWKKIQTRLWSSYHSWITLITHLSLTALWFLITIESITTVMWCLGPFAILKRVNSSRFPTGLFRTLTSSRSMALSSIRILTINQLAAPICASTSLYCTKSATLKNKSPRIKVFILTCLVTLATTCFLTNLILQSCRDCGYLSWRQRRWWTMVEKTMHLDKISSQQ